MNAQNYWQVFLETGAPEMYLLFNEARRSEKLNVFENPGSGSQGNCI